MLYFLTNISLNKLSNKFILFIASIVHNNTLIIVSNIVKILSKSKFLIVDILTIELTRKLIISKELNFNERISIMAVTIPIESLGTKKIIN